MATTLTLIKSLAISGARDATDGSVVASGVARFYDVGTTDLQTVYSDNSAASPITQPLTLGADGKATVYTLSPCRMIVKDATDTTTIIDEDPVNSIRADQVYVTNASVKAGVETTLDAYFTDIGGTGTVIDVKRDHSAAGDGTTDDTTAVQAAVTAAIAAGGGRIYFPEGTYKVAGEIDCTATGNLSITFFGEGRRTILSTTSTTADLLDLNDGSNTVEFYVRDMQFTAATTNSGSAIEATGAAGVGTLVVERCTFNNFRTSLNLGAGHIARDCVIETSDDNASSVGISLGADGRAVDCVVTSATDNGKGISLTGTRGQVRGCKVVNWDTSIDIAAAALYCVISGANISSSATGINAPATANATQISDVAITAVTDGIIAASIRNVLSNVVVITATTGITISGANSSIANCFVASTTTAYVLSGSAVKAVNCEADTATTGVTLSGADARLTNAYLASVTTGVTASGARCEARGVYTDASGTGITLSGADARAVDCHAIGVATGVTASGTNCEVAGVHTDASGTGVDLTGTEARMRGGRVTGATTGVSCGAAKTAVTDATIEGSTTGVAVGAFANCLVSGISFNGNTTDLTINASATELSIGPMNNADTITDSSSSAAKAHGWMGHFQMPLVLGPVRKVSGAPGAYDPDAGDRIFIAEFTSGSSAGITIGAPTGTPQEGQTLTVFVQMNGLGSITSVTFTSGSGNFQPATALASTLSDGDWAVWTFIYAGSGATPGYCEISQYETTANSAGGEPW